MLFRSPLKPKPFWCYLGFYFDSKLSFHEHVRFYSTKALTTIQAMRMLGNSARGLLPDQKRTLYRSCVVPVALYGFRMWYYNGARNKGVIKMLTSMQRKAALWITGAFRTSPTGGVKLVKVTRLGIEPRTFWTYTKCSKPLSYPAVPVPVTFSLIP